MKTVAISCIFYFSIFILLANAKSPNKIFGGDRVVRIEDHPHQVSIRHRNRHICSGSIISYYHILTAASCVTADVGVFYANIKVLSGTINKNDVTNGHIHPVMLSIVHSHYSPRNFWRNDVALLRLADRLVPMNTCKPISVSRTSMPSRNSFEITGWGGLGGLNLPDLATAELKRITVRAVDDDLCWKFYEKFGGLSSTQKCAMSATPLTSYITPGDGGSGIISSNTLYGVVSVLTMDFDYPLIYTSVNVYLNWIHDMVVRY
ncbi:trypsin Tyr p 3.0101-like [Aphidius gifuensis]|uniref:trypsin Tyr p 3.0101-like n=1 Tax=Aphidius gifuensis TaxID=684658 RepID=UPI001CDBA2AA|nr:trypsin Tyr p 3.0101-like [Aphidius gifuensis]